MKYCPHCGAEYSDGTVSLCPACGKNRDLPEATDKQLNNGYDGYYDDVLPPDWDQVKDGVDQVLVRNIIVLIASVILIITICVALLYVH